jgi:hypothetical protein
VKNNIYFRILDYQMYLFNNWLHNLPLGWNLEPKFHESNVLRKCYDLCTNESVEKILSTIMGIKFFVAFLFFSGQQHLVVRLFDCVIG